MLVYASETGLAVLMGAMAVLWLIATIHHSMLASGVRTRSISGRGPHAAGAH